MNLTAAQSSTLRALTNRIQRNYGMPDEVMSFNIQEMNPDYGKDVMLVASNTGSPWYASHKLAVLIVGPRGGINRRNFTLDNMRASLVF